MEEAAYGLPSAKLILRVRELLIAAAQPRAVEPTLTEKPKPILTLDLSSTVLTLEKQESELGETRQDPVRTLLTRLRTLPVRPDVPQQPASRVANPLVESPPLVVEVTDGHIADVEIKNAKTIIGKNETIPHHIKRVDSVHIANHHEEGIIMKSYDSKKAEN